MPKAVPECLKRKSCIWNLNKNHTTSDSIATDAARGSCDFIKIFTAAFTRTGATSNLAFQITARRPKACVTLRVICRHYILVRTVCNNGESKVALIRRLAQLRWGTQTQHHSNFHLRTRPFTPQAATSIRMHRPTRRIH